MNSYVAVTYFLAVVYLAQGSIHSGVSLHDAGHAWGGHAGGWGAGLDHGAIAHTNLHGGWHGLYGHGSAITYTSTNRGHGIEIAHVGDHGLEAGLHGGHWGAHWH